MALCQGENRNGLRSVRLDQAISDSSPAFSGGLIEARHVKVLKDRDAVDPVSPFGLSPFGECPGTKTLPENLGECDRIGFGQV